VSTGRNGGGNGVQVGDPYTMEAFRESWKDAIESTAEIQGAPKFKHSWGLGTTPHGGRHYYGRELVSYGFDKVFRQSCMHHLHPDSQDVYTKPSPLEISSTLNAKVRGLEQSSPKILRPHADLVLATENLKRGQLL
jgi:hypothetical protein